MHRRLSRFYNVDRYTDLLDRRRAIAAYVLIVSGLVAFALGTYLDPDFPKLPDWVFGSLAIQIALIALWIALNRGHLTFVRRALVGLAVIGLFYPWLTGGFGVTGVAVQLLLLFTVTLLTNEYGVIGAVVITLVVDVVLYPGVSPVGLDVLDLSTVVTAASFTVLFGVLAFVLAQGWRRGLEYLGEQAAQQRLQMVELSAEITHRIFQRTDLETLLAETVLLVRDSFEHVYHAQIFLLDEDRRFAVLKASTGPVGQQLLAQGHRLEVGGKSVIGQVTIQAQPILARDTSTDPVHRRNELLPNTRTELALPLISGDQVIGALDVQSLIPGAFSPDDVSTLQTLANQVAVALDNARLFTGQQEVIQENERLMQQAHEQINQIQDLNRRLTHHAWSRYMGQQELVPALTVDFATEAMTPNAQWTPGLIDAVRSGEIVSTQDDEHGTVLAVPLSVRGQVIGAMEFDLGERRANNPEQTALIQNVADRLALSLESARLYEEAQRLAQREALINDIGARLQSTSGMEGALLVAAQGLQAALSAPRIAIRLGIPPAEAPVEEQPEGGEPSAV